MTTIKEFVAAVPGYLPEQKVALAAAIDRKLGKNEGEVVTREVFEEALRTQSVQAPARPDILFVNFGATQQELVNKIAAAFAEVTVMVDTALAGVGLSGTFSSTNYEVVFGKKALRSAASYAQRRQHVTQILTKIRASVADPWVIEYNQHAGDVASWSAGAKISIGRAFAGGGKFAAGVLIHEMGHRQGLVDVCTACLAAQIRLEHYRPEYTTAQLNCANNKEHGSDAMVRGDRGHFISNRRTKQLAALQKNLTVWNADSYRWYCYRFYKDEVQRSAPRPIIW